MSRILLSIKPEYAIKIFDGTKRFEYRKSIPKDRDIDTVVVYSSFPIQKVIGEFEIDGILSADPESIWAATKEYSGISSQFFFKYFRDKTMAHAIVVGNIKKYDEPKLIQEFNVHPPQSFCYL